MVGAKMCVTFGVAGGARLWTRPLISLLLWFPFEIELFFDEFCWPGLRLDGEMQTIGRGAGMHSRAAEKAFGWADHGRPSGTLLEQVVKCAEMCTVWPCLCESHGAATAFSSQSATQTALLCDFQNVLSEF